MKILLLPFTFNKFFSAGKRVSGVDEALLKQHQILSQDHTVKVFLGYSDIQAEDFKVFSRGQPDTSQRAMLQASLLGFIRDFKPDVILSNHYYMKSLFDKFITEKIPVLYLSHCLPGAPADFAAGIPLNQFLKHGHSLGCVSEFHKQKMEKYYKGKRTLWEGHNLDISVSSVVPSTYASEQIVQESDGKTVMHISACNRIKKTFLIPKYCADTEFSAEVYTTVGHMCSGKELDYFNENYPIYKDHTHLDVDHSILMVRIKSAMGFFVGMDNKDTFAITAIESLQNGVPILIYGTGNHPADGFVSPSLRSKCVSYFRSRDEFLSILRDYSTYTLSDRQEIANSCYTQMGPSSFKNAYETALHKTIGTFSGKSEDNSLEKFFV